MRTLVIIVAGFALWAACLALAGLLGAASTHSTMTGTVAFIVVWFGVAAVNCWVGVHRAGYPFREELPIFLLIFGLPAAVAVLAKWKFL